MITATITLIAAALLIRAWAAFDRWRFERRWQRDRAAAEARIRVGRTIATHDFLRRVDATRRKERAG